MNVNTGGAEEKLNSNTFMSVTMYTRNKNDVMGSKAVLIILYVLCVCVRSVCALCVCVPSLYPSFSVCSRMCQMLLCLYVASNC